jgi:hypothetical protein
MATAKDELAALKMRAAKRPKHTADKITLIDHTTGQRATSSVLEGIGWLANLVEKGGSEHMVHVVDLAEEKKRKLTNPTNATKRMLNCRTPEQWKELNAALEPYYEEAVDPHIAIDLIIRALRTQPRETIREWVSEGHGAPPSPSERMPGDEWFEDDLPEALR